ncbi:MAG: 3-deoxy-manno-octulosonate cytidylyltransferase [Fimbriimonadales bacterium]|nr:3-deoxy-manno-octulosonate cytidylyltransferase [Fimbriimonadales bacterium]
MRLLAVIPARMASTRFPGKPLVDLSGKPMIQWVYEAALAAEATDRVLVATPDREIVEAVSAFGGEAVLTRSDHPSGTDRIAEVAGRFEFDGYLNIQGDEPLIRPSAIRAVAEGLRSGAAVCSGFCECPPEEEPNPAVVKVALALDSRALYFSRHAIPYARNERAAPVWKHVGIYGYSREALLAFPRWGPSPLESTEGLEQLRFLEHGFHIRMVPVEASESAVDTPEQAEAVRRWLEVTHRR